MEMASVSSRRLFVKQAAMLVAATQASRWPTLAAAEPDGVIATTSAGRIRGIASEGVNVFKGIPYGGTAAGNNRFMPPTKPAPWTGVRERLPMDPLRRRRSTAVVDPREARQQPALHVRKAKTVWCSTSSHRA